MPPEKINAIVLSSTPFKESDRKVTLLSCDGKIFARLVGVAKPKAKLAFASQPFCFAEFLLAFKGNSATVTGANAIDLFADIVKDYDKFSNATLILDVTNVLSREKQNTKDLFVLVLKALKMLAYSSAKVDIVLCKFLLEGLKVAGYGVDFGSCLKCSEGLNGETFLSIGPVCKKCAEPFDEVIERPVSVFLKNCGNCSIDKIDTLFASDKITRLAKIKLIKIFEDRVGEILKSKDSIL